MRTKKSSSAGKARIWFEPMEGRTLLSAAPTFVGGAAISAPAAVPFASFTGVPVTFHAAAGVSYSGDVGMLTSSSATSAVPNPLLFRGIINWGDSAAATAARFTLGTDGKIHVQGTHTYSNTGTFAVTVTIYQNTLTPLPGSGAATASTTVTGPVPILPTPSIVIKSTAIVDANTTGGVTIHPLAGKPFTGVVGTFTLPALTPTPIPLSSTALVTTPVLQPALSATINWGDGQTSAGQIVPASSATAIAGTYSVIGTNTYKLPGTYHITIVVVQRISPTGLSRIVATINSTAIVLVPPVTPATA